MEELLKDNGFVHANIPVTIPAGSSVPATGVDFGGFLMFTFEIPTGFEGTTLTFLSASSLAGTYQPLYDDAGIEVSMVVAAGKNTPASGQTALALASARFIKPRSGTAATPVVQAADRAITISCKR